MSSPSVAAVQILKCTVPPQDQNGIESRVSEDLLAVEEPLEIRIVFGPENDRKEKNISVTMCTPGQDEELAAGFLFTEGIINKKEDLLDCRAHRVSGNNIVVAGLSHEISFDPIKLERHFYTSSSCGVCGKSSIAAVKNISPRPETKNTVRIDAAVLTKLPDILRSKQDVFEKTGGLHASALFDTKGTLISTREDVGRHNALDKLIGASLMAGTIPLDDQIVLLSGRASFELIQKAAMAGIKMVCAVGAPSSLAVELAKETDMTLVGFLRNGRFNIYCGENRIIK